MEGFWLEEAGKKQLVGKGVIVHDVCLRKRKNHILNVNKKGFYIFIRARRCDLCDFKITDIPL